MSGITIKIQSLYPDLPRSEKRVADYILNNPHRVPFLSVYDVAHAADVSVASVIRFVKGAGYRSFKYFKVELAKDTSSYAPEIFQAITPDDDEEEIVRKVFRGNIQSLENTLKVLNIGEFIEVSEKLSMVERILFLGIGSSGNVARDAALRFAHIDLQAEAHTEPVYMLISAKRLREGDAAVGISHSGRSKMTVEALRVAGENGALTVGISNYIKSPLSRYCRYIFCTSFSENRVKAAALSSRLAQLCLIDALYLLVALHKKNIWNIEDVNTMLEKLLRMKG